MHRLSVLCLSFLLLVSGLAEAQLNLGVRLAIPVTVPAGGTGVSTLTDGGLLVGAGTGPIEALPVGLTTQILVGGGAGTNPAWGTDLPTAVTIGGAYIYRAAGTDIPLADGGTNASLVAALGAMPYSTATALALLAPGTAGQLFRSGGAGAPTWTTSTWPTNSPAAGTYLRGDGTNWITSTLVLPNAATAFRLPVATSANTIGEVAAVGATGEYLAGATGAVPAWATLTQNAVAGLTTTDGPTFAHLHISDLAAIYTAAESWIGPSSTTGVYFKGGNVGIGTTEPDGRLHVMAASAGAVTANVLAGNLVVEADTNGGISILTPDANVAAIYFGDVTANNAGSIKYFHSTDRLAFQTNATEQMTILSGGNVGIVTITPGGSGTVGTAVLSLGNGTAPVGGVANQVSLFSADVTASAELFALDEAGNTPQLTPHPSDFLNTLPLTGREYPWAYSSSNAYLGKSIRVDMMGVVREVERLTGKKFIVLSDLAGEERADWDAGQEAQRAVREQAITVAQAQIIALNDQIAKETDPAKVKELTARQDAMTVPAAYKKKPPPKWMRDRGVVSATPVEEKL